MKAQIDRVLGGFLVVLLTIMVLNVLWQVASRYLLGSPSIFTDELANYLLIWLGLFGAAYATSKNIHLAIDILPNKLHGSQKKWLNAVIALCIVGFALAVMVIGGGRLVYLTFILEQRSASLQIPLGYIYLALPISGLLIIFFVFTKLFPKSL